MRLARIPAIFATAGVVLSTATAPTAVAAESSTLQCTSTAPIYRVTTAGDMYYYQHTEPETGANLAFVPNPPKIGAGWHLGRPLAGLDGNVYMAWTSDGALRRYHWNGTAWDTFAGGAQFEVIYPTGWQRYSTPEWKNMITADAEGDIYMVQPDGYLHWRRYDLATQTWQHRIIDTGWNTDFDLIAAAGRGVLYARTRTGVLYRYRYHADSGRWLSFGKQVGAGWGIYDRVFSAGGDVLYAVRPDATMWWYRWDENTETWISNTGRQVGAGWVDWATTGVPNACMRVGTSIPARPAVPAQPNGAMTLLGTSDNHVHLSYVDAEGRATYAEATDLSGATSVGFAVVPGFTGVTATTALTEYQDGTVLLTANGTDADMRESTRDAADVWATPARGGGFLATAPTSARLTASTVATFGLDANFGLWARRQTTANGPLQGWVGVGGTPLTHQRLTVVPTSTGVRIIGLGRDGQFHTATYENSVLSAWTPLGGSGFTGTASAVKMPDGTLQVFATDSTGAVRTQRQTTSGFPGTWTTLTGTTAAGNPSAIMAPDGALQVVVRGTDDYLYYASQSAPGATTFEPWRIITTQDQTSTDPTALAAPSVNSWVVAYITNTGLPKLRRYQPPTGSRSPEPFVEIPTTH